MAYHVFRCTRCGVLYARAGKPERCLTCGDHTGKKLRNNGSSLERLDPEDLGCAPEG